jgi:hypothetical protein
LPNFVKQLTLPVGEGDAALQAIGRQGTRGVRQSPDHENGAGRRAALGLDAIGIIQVVSALRPSNFYKSMTTHGDHRVWQDVYRPKTPFGEVYLKLSVVEDVLIVSFKEL